MLYYLLDRAGVVLDVLPPVHATFAELCIQYPGLARIVPVEVRHVAS